jgi:hypothetical protein
MFDNQRPASVDERAAIAANIKTSFFDPYSIRDAQISSAVVSTGIDSSTTPMICVDANAKNRVGAYAGRQTTVYYFAPEGRIGRVANSSNDVFVEAFCKDNRLRYTPFSEIEQKT